MNNQPKSSLETALAHAKLGHYIVPIWNCDETGRCRCGKPNDAPKHKPGKHPQGQLVPHGISDASCNPEIITNWYTKDAGAGVGIACKKSGLVVIDIDPRNGGYDTLERLEAEHGSLRSAVTAKTQGNGEHRVFKADVGARYQTGLGDGIDVIHNGYICVEPSRAEFGNYRWLDNSNPLLDVEPSPPPPILKNSPPNLVSIDQAELRESITHEPPTEDEVCDLRHALHLIPAHDYAMWINVGLALKTAGTAGSTLWLDWSKSSSKFNAIDDAKTWESLVPTGTHWKAIFSYKNAAINKWIDRLKIGGKPITTSALHKIIDEQTGKISVLDSPIKPLTEAEAGAARLHPRMLVENYLYADLRNIVAAGGVGKTTTLLYEAMNGALGRPIWGRHVPEPFTTVIVTKEDSREILIGRLKIMLDENELSPDERQQVWSRVYVIDLVGEPFKLAETKGQEIRPHWPNLEKLLMRCKPLSPDRFVFDPLMSFSAGESRVNDAEQAIVEAARHILRRFPGCAVDVVHHTGKANARLATTDQYSGRNGSALPDGSRMVAVLVKCSPATFYAETGINLGPPDIESGLKLALPKLSYCAPQPDVLIHRHSFLFRTVPALDQDKRATLAEKAKLVNKEVARESTRYSLVRALTDCTDSEDPKIRYPSRSCVIELPGVIGKSTSRKSALEELIDMGAVLEIDLTEDQIKEFSSKAMLGGRHTYLTLPPEDL